MKFNILPPFFLTVLALLTQCTNPKTSEQRLSSLVSDSESIKGKSTYLNSPYVTAGDRVYMVGYQNGQFPDLGWHING